MKDCVVGKENLLPMSNAVASTFEHFSTCIITRPGLRIEDSG